MLMVVGGENEDKITINVSGNLKVSSTADGIFTNNADQNGISINAGNIYVDAKSRNGVYNSGTLASTDAKNDISITANSGDITILSSSTDGKTAGVKSKNSGKTELTSTNGNIYIGQIDDETGELTTVGSNTNGIYAAAGTVNLTAGKDNKIYATHNGIYATGAGTKVTLNAENNTINVENNDGRAVGVWAENGAQKEVTSTNGNVKIVAKDSCLKPDPEEEPTATVGVYAVDSIAIVTAHNGSTIINALAEHDDKAYGVRVYSKNNTQSSVEIRSDISNIVYGDQHAVFTSGKNASANIISDIGSNFLSAKGIAVTADSTSNMNIESKNGSNWIVSKANTGIHSISGSQIVVKAEKGYNVIESNLETGYGISVRKENSNVTLTAVDNEVRATGKGIFAWEKGLAKLNASNSNLISSDQYGVWTVDGSVDLNANNNNQIISSDSHGIVAQNNGSTELNAGNSNLISSAQYGIYADNDSTVNLNAHKGYNYVEGNKGAAIYSSNAGVDLTGVENIVSAAVDKDGYGSKHAIKADSTATVNLNATVGDNVLAGVIYAKDEGTNVTLSHNNGANTGTGSNYIYSSAHGSNDAVGDRSHVVAALYAQNQGKINVTAGEGGINHIESYFEFVKDDPNGEHADDSERTVWAQRGGVVEIKGTTIIKSSNDFGNYKDGYATNSRGVAITAGSGDTNVTIPSGDIRSTVNLEYGPNVTIGENTFRSEIYGDIAAGYGGKINIKKFSDNVEYGLYVEGNALAANGGTLDMNLGEGGTWYGRADDYQDAGQFGHGSGEANSFFNPVFSNKITSAGTVNVTLGKGSKWYLTGQSWITTVNGVTEDIRDAEKPVIDINNSNTWLGDKGEATSSALTIGTLNGNVNFKMNLDGNDVKQSDMLYIRDAQGKYDVSLNDTVTTEEINKGHDGLRFATVGKGSNAEFRVCSFDNGFFNVEYEVETDSYDGHKENTLYNGENLDTNKPGDKAVDKFFEDKVVTTLNEITEDDQQLKETTNFKIVARLGEDLSEGGKTVVNMSKVNYNNAVYMDRLNKRLGEARYINPEDEQGMWVRLRHDRIGKDNEFRIMNTMYELGYDEKQECDNGERRVGVAIDYMDGSSEYTGVGGTGEISRKGIWLYDTWMGDKGHYADYVAKWGHLSNDFTLYRDNKEISGDFSNNVYSISAEYGRKKDIGNDWYFEPQVQLQYARVTDANYTTSQGTEVSLDAINSLIARAGFRLGKDLGERSTVYFKADLLHEFLGDQDIAARDKTTDGKWTNVTYGNEGTWCDIGFGFATAMSKTSYAYLDVETSLGNDYEETYQINAGLQWSF